MAFYRIKRLLRLFSHLRCKWQAVQVGHRFKPTTPIRRARGISDMIAGHSRAPQAASMLASTEERL